MVGRHLATPGYDHNTKSSLFEPMNGGNFQQDNNDGETEYVFPAHDGLTWQRTAKPFEYWYIREEHTERSDD